MAGFVTPGWITAILTGAAMLALAIWLLWLSGSSPAHRAFAFLLGARAWSFLASPVRRAVQDDYPGFADLLTTSIGVLQPIVLALIFWFLSRYPVRRSILSRSSLAGLGYWAIAVGLSAWILIRPEDRYERLADGTFVDGPLISVTAALTLGLAIAAAVLARDHARAPGGSAGSSRFLIAAGFALRALYDGVLQTLELGAVLRSGEPIVGWTWVLELGNAATLIPAVVALGILTHTAFRADEATVRRGTRRFVMYAAPLPILSGFLAFGVDHFGWLGGFGADSPLTIFMLGLWTLILPLFVTYALLRFQLFGIDLRVKAGVRRAVIMGAFTMTFFLVTETVEAFVASDQGPAFGIAAAGVLAVASRPVETLSERAADSLMPTVKPMAELNRAERLAFYGDQYRLVHEDGKVTGKERRMLGQLAFRLQLSPEDVADIESRFGRPTA